MRWSRTIVLVAGCALAGAVLDPSRLRRETPGIVAAGTQPDIVLITVDALRADHLGVYGYDRPTSPNLDALAREAAVVRDHIAQAPYTKASVATLFTGRFPSSHKTYTVSSSFAQSMTGHVDGALPMTDVLDSKLWTLAGALTSAGYTTIGLNTNPFLLKDFGFASGFQEYRFLSGAGVFASAREVTREALRRLERRTARQPVFLWMHLMEPHSPYAPPARTRALFPPRQPARPAERSVIPPWLSEGGPPDANYYEALYDAEIADVDAAIGEFVDALRQRDLWQQVVFVVTSDHGEEFFDHGGFEHSNTLYDEMLRVPLFIKSPGLRPGMREIQTQAVDLAPTLAIAAGATVPRDLAGADISATLQRGAGADPIAFAERPGDRFAIRTREWKLISTLDGHDELFHLATDRLERVNLATKEPDQVARLRERMAAVLAGAYRAGAAVRQDVAPIPPGVLERLKALGYVH
jgi:arylsulfatase A-like enzyme